MLSVANEISGTVTLYAIDSGGGRADKDDLTQAVVTGAASFPTGSAGSFADELLGGDDDVLR